MKNLFLLFAVTFLMLTCKKDQQEPVSPWDSISTQKYYDTDLFTDLPIYGKWEVINTSGGKTGAGYAQDFDYLLMKPNGIFGLLKDNDLIVSGKIKWDSIVSDTILPLWPVISFSPEKSINIQILNDEIFIDLNTKQVN